MSLEQSVWDERTPPPSAVRVYASGVDAFAVSCFIDGETSLVTDVGRAVAGTPGGTGHGAVFSSGSLIIPAGVATSGGWQTGAQRWSWSLQQLGLSLDLVARFAFIQVQGASFSDGGEVRSGESGWGLYLGTSETTAVIAAGVGRPSGGTGYAASQWQTGSSAFNFGTANTGRRGGVSLGRIHDTNTGCLLSAGLTATGSMPSSGATGVASSAAPITHLVLWAGRRGTGTVSRFETVEPRGVVMWLVSVL